MASIGRPTAARRSKVGGDVDPEVFCSDEQDAVEVDLARWQALAEQVLAAEGVRGGTEMSIIFVDEEAISELNEEFLGHHGPTDVLSFPIDAAEIEVHSGGPLATRGPDRSPFDPADQPLLLGDIVVCPTVAVRQAPTHAGTVDDELALLIVHGILHILGYDHAEPEQEAAMRQRERELLQALHWNGPVPGAFQQEHNDS